MTYKMTIKGNEITINTDAGTITGNTYNVKEVIKDEFPGIRWDGANKCWSMDSKEMDARVEDYRSYFTRVYKLAAASEATTATKVTVRANNGLCPKCGTYCYGDCTASR